MVIGFPSVLSTLDVSGNPGMTGTIPSGFFFSNASRIISLLAGYTALNGTFPNMTGSINNELKAIDLSHTDIDFCEEDHSAWTSSSLSSCRLGDTNAVDCQSLYPSVCKFVAVSPATANSPIAPSESQPSEKPPGSHGNRLTTSILLAIAVSLAFLTL